VYIKREVRELINVKRLQKENYNFRLITKDKNHTTKI